MVGDRYVTRSISQDLANIKTSQSAITLLSACEVNGSCYYEGRFGELLFSNRVYQFAHPSICLLVLFMRLRDCGDRRPSSFWESLNSSLPDGFFIVFLLWPDSRDGQLSYRLTHGTFGSMSVNKYRKNITECNCWFFKSYFALFNKCTYIGDMFYGW